jgi:hypothetical protein
MWADSNIVFFIFTPNKDTGGWCRG